MGSEAHFGEGTKLTVLDGEVSKKENINVTVLPPSPEEICRIKDTVTLVCVATNFYPDHVSIQWKVGGIPRTDGVATDPYATKIGGNPKNLTISSRLKVPKKEWQNPKNEFKCELSFYNGKDYWTIDNATNGITGSDYTRENYINSSNWMKLTYGVLIAKSGLYGLVIFVFVWRKGSSGKSVN